MAYEEGAKQKKHIMQIVVKIRGGDECREV